MSRQYKRSGDENFQFRFQFNVHKALGSMNISDLDIPLLAAIYGVAETDVAAELQFAHDRVEYYAEKLKKIEGTLCLPANQKTKILFLGDSNTSNRQSYYHIIRTALKGYPNIETKDLSISAQKAIDLFTAMYPNTIGERAELAHIMIGTNDVRRIDYLRDVYFTSPLEFKKNVDFIISSLMENGTKVIVSTLPPISEERTMVQYEGYHTVYPQEDRVLFNEIMIEVAGKYGAVVNQMENVYGQYTAEELTRDDGIHLNELGHELLAQNLLKILLDMIKNN